MIPIEKEDKKLFEQFKVYEDCYFCKKKTDMWHTPTNQPVCKKCSKTHSVKGIPRAWEEKNNNKNK